MPGYFGVKVAIADDIAGDGALCCLHDDGGLMIDVSEISAQVSRKISSDGVLYEFLNLRIKRGVIGSKAISVIILGYY